MKQLIAIVILFNVIKAFGSDYQVDTINVESNILNENRQIYLYKPDNFNQIDSVIFLYLLDGEYAGKRYREIQNERPNLQIIGIGIVNSNRNRDMLPVKQPDTFLSFIENELLPKVEDGFKVKERVLFGHSFAGGFVINSMMQSPGLFDKYIASSPTPIMKFIDSNIYKELDKELRKDIRLYFSYGSKDMKQVRKWSSRLHENLSGVELMHIKWKDDIFPNRNHNNSALISLTKGFNY